MIETDVAAENKPACSPQVYMMFTQRSRERERNTHKDQCAIQVLVMFLGDGSTVIDNHRLYAGLTTAPQMLKTAPESVMRKGGEGWEFCWRAL